jgi:hypothetical protein
MADPYVIHGEVPVEVDLSQFNRASPEELTGIALRIAREIEESGIPAHDVEASEARLASIEHRYHDFCESFPLIARSIVVMRSFHPHVFKEWLTKEYVKHISKIKETDAFLRVQAEFLVMMYRRGLGAHPAKKDVDQYRERTVRELKEEQRKFKEYEKEARAEVEAEEAEEKKKLAAAIVEQLKRARC